MKNKLKQNTLMALLAVSFVIIGGIAHLLQIWVSFPIRFFSLLFVIGTAIGIYYLIWLIIQATKENWQELHPEKELKQEVKPTEEQTNGNTKQ